MLISLERCVSFGWIFHQKFRNQVFCLVTAFVKRLSIQRVNSFFDAHQYGSHILTVEGRSTTEKNVEKDPASPVVNLLSVFTRYDLRSKVHGGPFRLIFILFLFENLGNTKINELDTLNIVLFLQKNVLRFKIPVADVVVMQVCNSRQNLPHDHGSLPLS